MKFLVDENVESAVVKTLRELGCDVLYISEKHCGVSDDAVFELAATDNRILITNDTDFGEMVFRQGKVLAGVVLMRFMAETSGKKVAAIKHLLKYHKEKLKGHFAVISETQIKIRPL